MPREPLVIMHEFSAAGYRRYLKGQKPGNFKTTDEVYGIKDEKNDNKEKSDVGEKRAGSNPQSLANSEI